MHFQLDLNIQIIFTIFKLWCGNKQVTKACEQKKTHKTCKFLINFKSRKIIYLLIPHVFGFLRKPGSGLRFARWAVRKPSDQYEAYIKFGGPIFYYRV